MQLALNNQYRSVLVPVLSAAFCFLLVLSIGIYLIRSQQPSVLGHVDMPLYHSIEELTAVSDLAVRGTVGRLVGRETDYGTSDPDQKQGMGLPIAFYEVAVSETLYGVLPSTTITVGIPDSDFLHLPGFATPLQRNQEVLLFLNEETSSTAPGIKREGPLYSTVSMDNGIFERQDNLTFAPRMSVLFSQDSYSLDDARESS